ncbi:MAG: hypothetical protein PHP82_03400 [Candidatus ainarchaeum sp.]|nr:hypothetical protein [Candidatus ainarchaeum sp.]
MIFVKSEQIINFFEKLNQSEINYILIRNINSELPNSLIIGKDIDILVNKKDKKKFIEFMKNNNFVEIKHPFSQDKFLYNLDKFKMFKNDSNILIDVCFQLANRSTNLGEWIPLHKNIQESSFKNKKFLKFGKLSCFCLSSEDELVILVSRSILDKKNFQDGYIKRIEYLLEKTNKIEVKYKLSLIFFKYALVILQKLKNKEYSFIINNYISFKEY